MGFLRDTADRVTQKFINTFPNGVATEQEVTQNTYDGADRVTCSAVRMNPAYFGSLPASACTSGPSGSDGPDRITQYGYDNADRLTSTTEGANSPAPTTSLTYTANGQPQTLTDADGNVTTFVYDNWTRLSQVEFPSPTTPGQSSTTDFIGYTYNDTTWNVDTLRLRDGQTVTNSYDWRHNRTAKNLPYTNYTYDNFDRLISIASGGQTLTETYDALGRRTAEGGPLGTVTSQYDAAGRRTKLSLPDGYFSTYDYDNAGAMTDIKDQSGTPLVTFGYDDFNRLASISRYDGVSTTYGYDTLSRVTSLAQTFSGASNPNNVTITLAYDPANDITSRSLSNSAYHWAGTKGTTTYGVNGLNQITNANGTAFSYDGRGNLTNDGTKSYTYDAANRMTAAGPVTLSYDPLNRLSKTVDGSTTTQFVYDGPNIVAEYDGNGSLVKRYVDGPGVDQPLVIYENGTADWPLADERGSIMAVANNSGGLLAANTYDEYGLPGASNYGRFQYTGQAWLPDTGLYSYKAREYSPALGRFMQTDPTGYRGGPNLYTYAAEDPINIADPTGQFSFRQLLTNFAKIFGSAWDAVFGNNMGLGCGGGACIPIEGVTVTADPNRYGHVNPLGLSWLFMGTGGGLTGGSAVSGAGEARSAPKGPNNKPVCPSGTRISIPIASYGATGFLGVMGGSLGAEVGISIPTSGGFAGTQLYGSVSATGLGGLGAFAGAGQNFGYSVAPGPISTGPSETPVLQGGAGWEAGGEFSGSIGSLSGGVGDLSQGVQVGGSGGPRGALGVYAATGLKGSYTVASPQLGCAAH